MDLAAFTKEREREREYLAISRARQLLVTSSTWRRNSFGVHVLDGARQRYIALPLPLPLRRAKRHQADKRGRTRTVQVSTGSVRYRWIFSRRAFDGRSRIIQAAKSNNDESSLSRRAASRIDLPARAVNKCPAACRDGFFAPWSSRTSGTSVYAGRQVWPIAGRRKKPAASTRRGNN